MHTQLHTNQTLDIYIDKYHTSESFLHTLYEQIDAVNALFLATERELNAALVAHDGAAALVHQAATHPPVQFEQAVRDLHRYAVLNYLAVLKLAQDHDERYVLTPRYDDIVDYMRSQAFCTALEHSYLFDTLSHADLATSPRAVGTDNRLDGEVRSSLNLLMRRLAPSTHTERVIESLFGIPRAETGRYSPSSVLGPDALESSSSSSSDTSESTSNSSSLDALSLLPSNLDVTKSRTLTPTPRTPTPKLPVRIGTSKFVSPADKEQIETVTASSPHSWDGPQLRVEMQDRAEPADAIKRSIAWVLPTRDLDAATEVDEVFAFD